MSTQHIPLLSLLFSSLLVLALANPQAFSSHDPPKEAMEVVVEGMVYCQSCMHAGTWSLADAKPLPSSKVGISCRDLKNRVKFYKAFQTDSHGYFFAPLHGLGMKNQQYLGDFTRRCTVHLLSSSDHDCNLLTNINSGIAGSPLRYVNEKVSGKSFGAVVYAAGPLAFRPAYCPPMTHY